MELVDCTPEFWEFVRIIRTHPNNRDFFLSQADITPTQQIEFMTKNSHKYKVCLLDGHPVGYIGLINDNEITYCVHPEYQNKGIGTFMVNKFSHVYPVLTAYVLPENIRSGKVFEKLGFKKRIYYIKENNK